MNYQTFEPSSELNACVKCYWTLENPMEEIPQRQRIVPDGCMELIFHLGDLYRQYAEDGSHIIQPRCFVFGQITQPLEIEPTGETGIFAVRFHPEGFMPFATLPIKKMDNQAVSLEKLFGEAGLELERQVLAAQTTPEKINRVESFLIARLSNILKNTASRMLSWKQQRQLIVLSNQPLKPY